MSKIILNREELSSLNAIVANIWQMTGEIDPETNPAFTIAEEHGWMLEVSDEEEYSGGPMWRVARFYDEYEEVFLEIFVCETPEESENPDDGEKIRRVA